MMARAFDPKLILSLILKNGEKLRQYRSKPLDFKKTGPRKLINPLTRDRFNDRPARIAISP
jgi:hypothetical protein